MPLVLLQGLDALPYLIRALSAPSDPRTWALIAPPYWSPTIDGVPVTVTTGWMLLALVLWNSKSEAEKWVLTTPVLRTGKVNCQFLSMHWVPYCIKAPLHTSSPVLWEGITSILPMRKLKLREL